MPGLRLSTLVRRMRAEVPAGDGCSDADLLARFVRTRDEAAFELLVWRHGAMVLAACNRLLRHREDAEDAFQAVFLVLARKARGVSRGAALPAWLHRVALRTSTRLAGSRRVTVQVEAEPVAPAEPDPAAQAESLGILDAEIDRLPERLRRAVVLCYLEGLSASEAAKRLDCPTGTVESRLASARKKLRGRLTRRGVTLPTVLAVGGQLAPEAVARTVRAASAFAQGTAAGVANESSVRLAQGVLTMWRTKTWAATFLATAVLAAVVSAGFVWAARPTAAPPEPVAVATPEDPPKPPVPAEVKPRSEENKPDPKSNVWGPVRNFGKADGMLYAVSPDGNEIVVRPTGTAVTLLDLRTGKTRRVNGNFSGHNWSIAYSPDGKLVACAGWDQGATIRDAKTWAVIDHIRPSAGHAVSMAAFTPDGTRVAFYCWTWRGGSLPSDPEKSIAHFDYQLMLWDVANKKELGWPTRKESAPALHHVVQKLFPNRPFFMTRVEVPTPNGLAASKTFTLTDATTNKATPKIAIDKDDDWQFDVTPDGKQVLMMTAGKDPRFVDVQTGKSGRSFGGHKRLVTTAALSRDGKLVLTASGQRTDGATAAKIGGWRPEVGPTEMRLHDAATGELVAAFVSDALFDFRYVGFSPDGKYVWAQTADYELLLWGKYTSPPADVAVQWPVEPKPFDPFQPFQQGGPLRRWPPFEPEEPPDTLDKLVASLAKSGRTAAQQTEALFLAAFGRLPTADEQKRVAVIIGEKPTVEKLKAVLDALVQSPEFAAHAKAMLKRAKPDLEFPNDWRDSRPAIRYGPPPVEPEPKKP